MHPHNLLDIVGQRFARLRVVERRGSYKNKAMWLCACDCGGSAVVCTNGLRNGHTKSCGCLKAESKPRLTHGHGGADGTGRTRTFQTWIGMRRRSYANGMPIPVTERWRRFENFLADMGERPDGHTLDRIDNAGVYEPENCRWADRKTQNRNRGNTRWIELNGERRPVGEWAEIMGIPYKTLYQRVAKGRPPEHCLREYLAAA